MHMAVDNSRDNKEIFCIEMVFVINDPSVVNDEIKHGF